MAVLMCKFSQIFEQSRMNNFVELEDPDGSPTRSSTRTNNLQFEADHHLYVLGFLEEDDVAK